MGLGEYWAGYTVGAFMNEPPPPESGGNGGGNVGCRDTCLGCLVLLGAIVVLSVIITGLLTFCAG